MNRSDDEIEMLLAARLPGELTGAERAEVDRLVSQDASARRTAAAYEKLATLLKGWRMLPADINWRVNAANFSQHVHAGVSVNEQMTNDGVEQLVPHWSGPVPPVDYLALRSRISAAVRREAAATRPASIGKIRTRRRVLSWVGRVGAPLAVAAAIAIAVWWPRDAVGPTPDSTDPRGLVAKNSADSGSRRPRNRSVLVSLDTPESTGTVTVKLDEAKRNVNGAAVPDGWAGIAGDSGEDHAVDYSDDPFLY